jgi:hypothetical protein
MDDQHDKPGFRVTDHRRFTESGETRSAGDPSPQPGEPSPQPAEPARASAPDALVPITFSTFLLGLSTQALLHLGEIESPLTGKIERDLAAAQHMIDILGLLREKTRNNLEQAEEQLLDSVLYDLRIRYVELVRASKKEEA